MATTKVIDIIKRVQRVCNDKTGAVWEAKELLEDFNDAIKDIVLHRPDASTVNKFFDCVPESSKQSLPDDALQLIEVIRNKDGSIIAKVARKMLDVMNPVWHQSEPTANIESYVYDERDRKHFYLYPRPAGTTEEPHQVEVVYSTCPADVALTDEELEAGTSDKTIPLEDTYSNAIIDFMLYRAYSKDLGSAANMARSARHYQTYGNALGVKLQADAMMMKGT
tara:strand:+ start:1240 stop:1908 length:669 start_codon:yes stop_codon:yes gene_type:complete